MGTRAVVRLNEEEIDTGVHGFWWATHWDGHPETLGEALVEAVQKAKGEVPSYDDESIVDDNKLRDYVEEACQDHTVDMEASGTPEQAREEFMEKYGDYGEFEYKFVRKGNEIRVKHRPVSGFWDDNPSRGEWKDTARTIGMSYTPFSFYAMYEAEDGRYKVKKTGNKQASAVEETPEEAWDRGMELVDSNVPARLYFQHETEEQTYENTEVGTRDR